MAAATSPQQQQHQEEQQHPLHHHNHRRVLSTPSLLTAAAGAAAARQQRQQQQQHQQQQPPPSSPPPHTTHPPGHPLPPIYLVVLNHHLPAVTAQLWPAAVLRVAADGGANRIHDELPPLARRVARARRRWQKQQQQKQHLLAGGGGGAAGGAEDDDDDDSPDEDDPSFHPLAFVPDALVGDLDSVRPEVKELYASRGSRVTDLSHDQDSTDLDKCLAHVESHLAAWAAGGGQAAAAAASPDAAPPPPPTLPPHHVVVVGALGGRLDHTLSNLGALHRFPHLSVTIWSDGNTVRLVRGGSGGGGGDASSTAAAPSSSSPSTRVVSDRRVEGPACGVVPLAGEATVTSRGLRWDMSATRLAFGVGGMLSTSNLLGGGGAAGEAGAGAGVGAGARAGDGDGHHEAVVELAADSDVLWMAEARDFVPPHVWDEAERRAADVMAAHAERAGGANGGGGGA